MPTIPQLLAAAALRRNVADAGGADTRLQVTPSWRKDDDPQANVLVKPLMTPPAATNADTVYYPPRDAIPISPRRTNPIPSRRLEDSLTVERFGNDKDILLPPQGQVDLYMPRQPVPTAEYGDEIQPRRSEDIDKLEQKKQAAAALMRALREQ